MSPSTKKLARIRNTDFDAYHEIFKNQISYIVGGGRIGARLAGQMEKEGIKTRLIEASKTRCLELAEQMDKTVVLHGDGSDQKLFLEENLSQIDAVISVTDTECKTFLLLALIFTLVITLDIHGRVYDSFAAAFRFASFQAVSILTTTGYATADYELFPGLSQVILFACMFMGASAGSTGGGMKIARPIVCFKFAYRELFRLIHPRNVRHVKLNRMVVSEDILRSIMGFLALYLFLFVAASAVLAAMGLDLVTALGAVASCLGNIGPGFGTVGPAENFAHLPAMAKWVLAWCMLLGRLEIYTVIILVVPEFWK